MDHRRRVLLMVTNLAMGGAERAIVRYAVALSDAGWQPTLLLLEDRRDFAVPEGITVEVLRRGRLRTGLFGKLLAALALRFWLMRAGRFDLAISTLPLTDEIARRAGVPRLVPRIASALSAEIASMRRQSRAGARRRRYRALYAGRPVIAVSEGVAADLVANFGVPPGDAHVIRNPMDFAAIRRGALAPVDDLPPEPYVLHVGRFMRLKRHDVLLEAFRRSGIPHRLVLLTAGDTRLDAMIADKGLTDRVSVLGLRDNPFPYMRHAAALVLSSAREGMPNVLVEAIACGTPVVSTDCPSGPSEILVGPLARWLVPVDDPDALAEKLRVLIAAPPVVGPADVEGFSVTRFLAGIDRLATRMTR